MNYTPQTFTDIPESKAFATRVKGPLRVAVEALQPMQGVAVESGKRNSISTITKGIREAAKAGGYAEPTFVTRKHENPELIWVIRKS